MTPLSSAIVLHLLGTFLGASAFVHIPCLSHRSARSASADAAPASILRLHGDSARRRRPLLPRLDGSPSASDRVRPSTTADDGTVNLSSQRRRDFVIRLSERAAALSFALGAGIASAPPAALAASGDDAGEGDLTTRMFNTDGSLRDPNTIAEAKSRTVSVPFLSAKSSSALSRDGAASVVYSPSVDDVSSTTSAAVRASYEVPVKWNDGVLAPDRPLYYDASEGKNGQGCDRITVYSVASGFDPKALEKASRVGVAKALFMGNIPDYFPAGVFKADLISGRTISKPVAVGSPDAGQYDEQLHYEFDLAFAPPVCPSMTAENLGLGFCPYDSIFLISATIWEGSMYVCTVECNKDEWKMANSEVKRVRSSFIVEKA